MVHPSLLYILQPLLLDIRRMLKMDDWHPSLVHAYMEANRSANHLANLGHSGISSPLFSSFPPHFV